MHNEKTYSPSSSPKTWIKIILVFLLTVFMSSNFFLFGRSTIRSISGQSKTAEGSRTTDYYWYDFFEAPMISDVWLARESYYGDVRVLSWSYPVVYEWVSLTGTTLPDGSPNPHPEGSLYYYAPANFRVTGRNLPEINITRPEFAPHNLLGGLPPTIIDGNANLTYYMQYITIARAQQLKIYTPASYDGYISELNGTIQMDRDGTMQILGLTPTEYDSLAANPTGWWIANEENIETLWKDFLVYEANTRLEIQPMFEYTYEIFSSVTFPGVDLSLQYDVGNDLVTVSLDVVAWGNEALLARWFHETFLKGYEYWYSDLTLDVAINSSSSHINLDTAVDFALYQWSVASEKYAPGVWAFEPVLGDEVASIKISGKTYYSKEFAPYILPNGTYKSYYNMAPGNAWYGEYQPYDYVPGAWNLLDGETLSINYSLLTPVWALEQNMDGTLTNRTGFLGVPYLEPYPSSFPGQILLNSTSKVLTFLGPLIAEEWLRLNFTEEWTRLSDSTYPNGVLPWGVPYIEFFLESEATHDISVVSVSALPSSVTPGESVEIETIVVNLGDLVESFNVSVYYNDTAFHEIQDTTLIRHQGLVLSFQWNTTGLPFGTYMIKVVASQVANESNLWNNVNYAIVNLTSATPPTIHDVKVSDVKVSPATAFLGDLVTIEITASNIGTATENFNATTFYDSKTIGSVTFLDVAPGEDRSVQFLWNTAAILPGNYTISVLAGPVTDETSTADNTFIYGTVTILKTTSTITLAVVPSTMEVGNGSATLTGRVTPVIQSVTVIIYYRIAEGSWSTLTSVVTDSDGKFACEWVPTEPEAYELKAQWLGDAYTESSESNICVLLAKGSPQQPPKLPQPDQNPMGINIVYLLIGIIVGAVPPIAFFAVTKKRSSSQNQEV